MIKLNANDFGFIYFRSYILLIFVPFPRALLILDKISQNAEGTRPDVNNNWIPAPWLEVFLVMPWDMPTNKLQTRLT